MLFHVTKQENVKSILREGLKAQIGANSQEVLEAENMVYLCDEDSVPYWSIILGADAVVRVSGIQPDSCAKFEYGLYVEFAYHNDIAPENIEVYSGEIPDRGAAMKSLCLSYISTVSVISVHAARFYDNLELWNGQSYNANISKKILKSEFRSTTLALNRLDSSTCFTDDIRSHIKDRGENGHYVFTDYYKSTDKRLWEMLSFYPDDDLKGERELFQNAVCRVYKDCLYENTGEWLEC